eukprot:m.460219 g.460219  ORF g.460219 m.460219 type:complete len:244 (+) comp20342_c8_seq3:144-875(+)
MAAQLAVVVVLCLAVTTTSRHHDHDLVHLDAEMVSWDPLVYKVARVLNSSECEHIIALARSRIQPATVGHAFGNQVPSHQARTNQFTWVPHEHDKVTTQIADRISRVIAEPPAHAENIQVLHYSPGEYYDVHFDAFEFDDATHPHTAAIWNNGRNRVWTVLVYLNNVTAGGETQFPELNVKVRPVAGTAVVFRNTLVEDPDTLDERTAHQALPTTTGEKWAFNLWYRARPHRRGTKARLAKQP